MSAKELDVNYISFETGGDVCLNIKLNQYIPINPVTQKIIEKCNYGTGIFKFGNEDSKGVRVAILSGVHGNELPPQIASLNLINKLNNINLNGTVFIIPFFAPYSTRRNSRWFDGKDLNRASSTKGTISNDLLNIFKDLKIDSVGDFHSTAPNTNPGVESVFCSKRPSNKSYEIAQYISNDVGSKLICYELAGQVFNGALEDEFNLNAIPSVTCEVLSFNGQLNKESCQRSLLQMESYLKYFDII